MSSSSQKGMEYVRVYTALLADPKFEKLVDFLKEKKEKFSERDVVGSLVLLWLKTGSHNSDGHIRDEHDPTKRVSKFSQWHGDSKTWVEALVYARFVDKVTANDFYVHNWVEKHAKAWLEKSQRYAHVKELARIRAQRSRDKQKKIQDEREKLSQENRLLREKVGIRYDESPPPERHAKTPLLTRDERELTRDASVTLRDDALRTPKTFEHFLNITLDESKKEAKNAPKDETINDNSASRENSARPRESRVTNALVPDNRIEQNKPSSKGTEVVSLRDQETTSGASAPKREGLDISDPENHPQQVIDHWHNLYLRVTGKQCPDDMGRLGRARKIWNRKGYSNQEIIRRIEFFFQSEWEEIKARNFPIGEFQKRFNELESGPLRPFAVGIYSTKEPSHGEDLRKFNPARGGDRFKPDN